MIPVVTQLFVSLAVPELELTPLLLLTSSALMADSVLWWR